MNIIYDITACIVIVIYIVLTVMGSNVTSTSKYKKRNPK